MNEKIVRILCLALAEYARIEAMKAANMARVMRGESLAYHEESFGYATGVLEGLAQEVINQ